MNALEALFRAVVGHRGWGAREGIGRVRYTCLQWTSRRMAPRMLDAHTFDLRINSPPARDQLPSHVVHHRRFRTHTSETSVMPRGVRRVSPKRHTQHVPLTCAVALEYWVVRTTLVSIWSGKDSEERSGSLMRSLQTSVNDGET